MWVWLNGATPLSWSMLEGSEIQIVSGGSEHVRREGRTSVSASV